MMQSINVLSGCAVIHSYEFLPMSAPTCIPHYHIAGKIGEGGIGAVYRPTGTELGRVVAIKVLPDRFCFSSRQLARLDAGG